MYAFIDALFSLGGLSFFICSLASVQPLKPIYSPIAIGWWALYPLLLEGTYNLLASICGDKVVYDISLNSRLVYSENTNLSFCGLERLHPFDAQKYKNVYNFLIDKGVIKSEKDVIQPNKISRSLLLEKVSKLYLLKMCYAIPLSSYIQLPVCFLPAWALRWRVLNPMLTATQGTILASVAATKLKWSVNVGGGFHHANCNIGGGFCVYPDISMAVHYVQTRLNLKKVMIVDLDAHQGNGHENDHIDNPDVFIVDAYNHDIYPGDRAAKRAIGLDIALTHQTTDEGLLKKMEKIRDQMDSFRPQFLIYNAGTDILQGDPLGGLSITPEGIIKRDELMIRMCLQKNVPVVMVLSGGYQKTNAKIIADSIENLMQKFS